MKSVARRVSDGARRPDRERADGLTVHVGDASDPALADPDAFKKQVKLVFVSYGGKEKTETAKANHAALEKLGVKSVYYEESVFGLTVREVVRALKRDEYRLIVLANGHGAANQQGTLDRIACWTRVFGMVNSAPGFTRQPAVINGFTELIVTVFGHERGTHARSAVGLAELPFRIPVEIEGEVELRGV